MAPDENRGAAVLVTSFEEEMETCGIICRPWW